MFGQQSSVTGVDIGAYSIKCVSLIRKKDFFELTHAGYYLVGNTGPSELSAIFKPYFDADPTLKKKVRFSLSGPQVVVRRITLPIMTHAELKDAIRFEAESHIPFAIDECVLDFQILNQIPNQPMMNVLLGAARLEYVQERIRFLSDLNIQPDWADLDSFCLINAFELFSDRPISESHGLLNIGHRGSQFVIIQQGLPYAVREIPRGGQDLTRALSETKVIEMTDAEKLKHDASGAAASDEMKTLLSSVMEPLAQELKNSVEAFEAETNEKIGWIGLSGGGARVAGLDVFLSESLGKRVTSWNNLSKIKSPKGDLPVDFANRASEYVVALGAAATGLGRTK